MKNMSHKPIPILAILLKLALACFVFYSAYKDGQPVLYNFSWAFLILFTIIKPFRRKNKEKN